MRAGGRRGGEGGGLAFAGMRASRASCGCLALPSWLADTSHRHADTPAAFPPLRPAACRYAQYNRGFMHMRGMAGPPNHAEALRLFRAAAANGVPAAYNGIGVLHYHGQVGAEAGSKGLPAS